MGKENKVGYTIGLRMRLAGPLADSDGVKSRISTIITNMAQTDGRTNELASTPFRKDAGHVLKRSKFISLMTEVEIKMTGKTRPTDQRRVLYNEIQGRREGGDIGDFDRGPRGALKKKKGKKEKKRKRGGKRKKNN